MHNICSIRGVWLDSRGKPSEFCDLGGCMLTQPEFSESQRFSLPKNNRHARKRNCCNAGQGPCYSHSL